MKGIILNQNVYTIDANGVANFPNGIKAEDKDVPVETISTDDITDNWEGSDSNE